MKKQVRHTWALLSIIVKFYFLPKEDTWNALKLRSLFAKEETSAFESGTWDVSTWGSQVGWCRIMTWGEKIVLSGSEDAV